MKQVNMLKTRSQHRLKDTLFSDFLVRDSAISTCCHPAWFCAPVYADWFGFVRSKLEKLLMQVWSVPCHVRCGVWHAAAVLM